MSVIIQSKSSRYYYNFGASGLHQLRWVAYRICGGKKDFGRFSQDTGVNYDWPYIVALQEFPNLMWHRDNRGTYTKRGKVKKFTDSPMTGNSVQLLRELKRLNAEGGEYKNQIRWDDIFPQLYALVKDVVENGDGKLALS